MCCRHQLHHQGAAVGPRPLRIQPRHQMNIAEKFRHGVVCPSFALMRPQGHAGLCRLSVNSGNNCRSAAAAAHGNAAVAQPRCGPWAPVSVRRCWGATAGHSSEILRRHRRSLLLCLEEPHQLDLGFNVTVAIPRSDVCIFPFESLPYAYTMKSVSESVPSGSGCSRTSNIF